jgi:electron transfer flavoprotein alpha subunit
MILVYAETQQDEFPDVTLEVVSGGRKLADGSKQELAAVLIGRGIEKLAEKLGHYGTDRVYAVDGEKYNRFDLFTYAAIIEELIRQYQPSIMLWGATPISEELACRVAARLRTGLISNCIDIKISPQGILEGAYNIGKKEVTLVCPECRPQMATILPGELRAARPNLKRKTSIEQINIGLSPNTDSCRLSDKGYEVVDFIKADPKTIDISEAEIIIAGGKGVASKENFQMLWQLADILGAAVGGSRISVDNSWVERERQIGQTGKAVAPLLLISCGISGASAHVIGMKSAKKVIAINKDSGAAIFKQATLEVVGDLHHIIPSLISSLQKEGF